MSLDGSTDWHNTAYSTSPVRTINGSPGYHSGPVEGFRGRRSQGRQDADSSSTRRREAELQEAGAVIANGYLRLDRDEWVRVVEKRRAALSR